MVVYGICFVSVFIFFMLWVCKCEIIVFVLRNSSFLNSVWLSRWNSVLSSLIMVSSGLCSDRLIIVILIVSKIMLMFLMVFQVSSCLIFCFVSVYSMFRSVEIVLIVIIRMFYYRGKFVCVSRFIVIFRMLKIFILIIMLDINVEVCDGVVGWVCGN